MSTAVDILDALLTIGHDALDGVDLQPDVKGVYHGAPPEQCCTDPGSLYAYWSEVRIRGVGDITTTHTGQPVIGGQTWAPRLRWWRCWPSLGEDGSFDQVKADELSRDFIRGTEAIMCALAREVCQPTGVLRTLSKCSGGVQVNAAVPITPGGGCAGVDIGITIDNRGACVAVLSDED